jgi:uncharacterized damage-inducible protein DinB
MARFSTWVNERLYDAVAKLDDARYRADSGLFFGSVHATLNHILVVDRLWTGRVQGIERGVRSLNQILHDDFAALRQARREEDAGLVELMDRFTDDELEASVRFWTVRRDQQIEARRRDLLSGMFNHQTHHRGQVYAVLLQAGLDLPDIDLIYYLVETGQARAVGWAGPDRVPPPRAR